MLKIPQCAGNQYWFITEEWNELVESSPIATIENPNPVRHASIVCRKQNLVIAMHPVAHAIIQQASGKQDYVLTDPLLIKREIYDWVIELNRQASDLQKAANNGDIERELREQIESDSAAAEDSGTEGRTPLSLV